MKIHINGTPKEIAALVVAIQERQEMNETQETIVYINGQQFSK